MFCVSHHFAQAFPVFALQGAKPAVAGTRKTQRDRRNAKFRIFLDLTLENSIGFAIRNRGTALNLAIFRDRQAIFKTTDAICALVDVPDSPVCAKRNARPEVPQGC